MEPAEVDGRDDRAHEMRALLIVGDEGGRTRPYEEPRRAAVRVRERLGTADG